MNAKDELLLRYLTWIESETVMDGYPEEERKRPRQIPPEFKHIHDYAKATHLVGWCSAYNESVLWNAGWVITGEGNVKLAELRIEEQLTTEPPKRTEPTEPEPKAERTDETELDEKALAVFVKNPKLKKKEIAKRIGCHEKSLTPKRCPRLSDAIRAYKAKPTDVPRGYKDSDGNFDAWEDD